MTQEKDESLEIQELSELRQTHFADLIRAAQLIFDPAGGVSGRTVEVDWQELGVPVGVEANLKSLGEQYRYSSPHIPIETIWKQLTPESRIWFIENKDQLWQIEEAFPALDED